jgi:hypothetical protein
MGRAIPIILLGLLVGGGCGKQTADEWLKEKMHPPTPAQRILSLESPRADVRREAVLAIEAHPDTYRSPSIIRVLCLLTRESTRTDVPESDPMVRAASCRVLGIMKGEDGLAALAKAVQKDSNKFVRMDAALALGRIGSTKTDVALASALNEDKDTDVRIAAAQALRFMKSKEAAEVLVAGLSNADIGITRMCWESLRYMTGQGLPSQPELWTAYLADNENPFAGYGKPPALPKGTSQRPQFTQGIGEFFQGLFGVDPGEAELQ